MENPNVMVTFYTDAVLLSHESESQGRPIYKDVPFVRKIVPGDQTNVIERVAEDEDQRRHPREWEKYKRETATNTIEGTPLEQWPGMTKSQVKEAKYFEVHTLEQLAALSDSNCQKLGMGFRELREKAKAYLDAASGNAATMKQASENQRLHDEIEALKAQIAEVRKPGRPKKELEAETA